uniref:Uncharacterized protein n=1 Tax=Poecilia mexicana TaxID=48701 RepID=A0A3B3X8U5_9TELE
MSVAYKDQLYAELKKQHNQNGTLFEDPEFPATNSSLYYTKTPPEVSCTFTGSPDKAA